MHVWHVGNELMHHAWFMKTKELVRPGKDMGKHACFFYPVSRSALSLQSLHMCYLLFKTSESSAVPRQPNIWPKTFQPTLRSLLFSLCFLLPAQSGIMVSWHLASMQSQRKRPEGTSSTCPTGHLHSSLPSCSSFASPWTLPCELASPPLSEVASKTSVQLAQMQWRAHLFRSRIHELGCLGTTLKTFKRLDVSD